MTYSDTFDMIAKVRKAAGEAMDNGDIELASSLAGLADASEYDLCLDLDADYDALLQEAAWYAW